MSDPLPIIVYSDVICPWCYVGKRRLEAALSDPGRPPGIPEDLRFSWRPFELNPDMPPEGIERKAYRARKFGEARSAELDRKMLETGAELGIAFAFDRMQRTPNTRLAHRLIWEAGRQDRQDALVDRLFRAYFEEALDIGERAVLETLAAESGLDAAGVASALSEEESLQAVVGLEQQGYGMGIQGVPFFILLQKYGISGAQPPEFWHDALPKIAAEAAGAAPATS
ncbi:MAG: DsbA family oxidoreductase [Hyphomicrobiaceae bacterium]|jgi:predicted DsbA family dithiol-disulfide isomerase